VFTSDESVERQGFQLYFGSEDQSWGHSTTAPLPGKIELLEVICFSKEIVMTYKHCAHAASLILIANNGMPPFAILLYVEVIDETITGLHLKFIDTRSKGQNDGRNDRKTAE